MSLIKNQSKHSEIIYYAYENILPPNEINVLLVHLISEEKNAEIDFLYFYKLNYDNNIEFFNNVYFENFIEFNWIKATEYFLDNVDIDYLADNSRLQNSYIPFFKKACEKNRFQILNLMLIKNTDFINFYNSQELPKDHLGEAIFNEFYEIANILIKYKKFKETFIKCFIPLSYNIDFYFDKVKKYNLKNNISEF